MNHDHWMQRCLELAKQGAGSVSPNPMVGALIVYSDGVVLGEGIHQQYGEPHAEVEAILDAEKRGNAGELRDATLYVNLEPCSHYGMTPPCADLILEKQIPRVVVGMEDPNPKVGGRGIARLREAGADVTVGVLETRAKRLNEGFIQHITTGRPLITLKIARTLDGKVGGLDGKTTTISSLESRTLVHRWRSELDAVLIGSGTALADDPKLTVRLVEGRQPVRIVLDREGLLPAKLNLFTDEHADKTVVVTGENAKPIYESVFTEGGGRVIRAPEFDGRLNLHALFNALGSGEGIDQPIQSVLVEAGPNLSTALIQQDLVDRLFIFTASKILGDGVPAFHSSKIKLKSFAETTSEQIGDDVLFKGFLRPV